MLYLLYNRGILRKKVVSMSLPYVSLITMIQQSMICLSDVCQNRPLLKMKNAGSAQKKTAA